MKNYENQPWHKPTLEKIVSAAVLALLLPLIAIVFTSAVHSWEKFTFENEPVTDFYSVFKLYAPDINLQHGTVASILLERNSAIDTSADTTITLERLVMVPVDKTVPQGAFQIFTGSGGIETIKKGQEALLIQKDLRQYIPGTVSLVGKYEWTLFLAIQLPLGVTRDVTYTSNVFSVTAQ